jgi:hypothetical protein
MKNKSTLIVSLFSIVIFAVLGVVLFNAYKKQTDGLVDTSQITTQEEENAVLSTNIRSVEVASQESKPLIVKGVKSKPEEVQSMNNLIQDIKQSTDKSLINVNVSAESNKTSNPDLNINNNQDNRQPSQTPAPVEPPIDNSVYTYYAPTPTAPLPVPEIPKTLVVEKPKPYVAPPEKTRLQSYIEAMNRLKNRGSEIIVPIVNNNLNALNFDGDPDLNNVLSYEYEVNSSKKGYSSFGSKTHIDTLKCARYISSCKIILKKYNSGRYYIMLGNVEFYLK